MQQLKFNLPVHWCSFSWAIPRIKSLQTLAFVQPRRDSWIVMAPILRRVLTWKVRHDREYIYHHHQHQLRWIWGCNGPGTSSYAWPRLHLRELVASTTNVRSTFSDSFKSLLLLRLETPCWLFQNHGKEKDQFFFKKKSSQISFLIRTWVVLLLFFIFFKKIEEEN